MNTRTGLAAPGGTGELDDSSTRKAFHLKDSTWYLVRLAAAQQGVTLRVWLEAVVRGEAERQLEGKVGQ